MKIKLILTTLLLLSPLSNPRASYVNKEEIEEKLLQEYTTMVEEEISGKLICLEVNIFDYENNPKMEPPYEVALIAVTEEEETLVKKPFEITINAGLYGSGISAINPINKNNKDYQHSTCISTIKAGE